MGGRYFFSRCKERKKENRHAKRGMGRRCRAREFAPKILFTLKRTPRFLDLPRERCESSHLCQRSGWPCSRSSCLTAGQPRGPPACRKRRGGALRSWTPPSRRATQAWPVAQVQRDRPPGVTPQVPPASPPRAKSSPRAAEPMPMPSPRWPLSQPPSSRLRYERRVRTSKRLRGRSIARAGCAPR